MWLLVHVVWALLKIEWLIVFTVLLLLANRICDFRFFLSFFLCNLAVLYVCTTFVVNKRIHYFAELSSDQTGHPYMTNLY